MTAARPRAVVIIPTRNERETIARIVPMVLEQQTRLAAMELHVLVVDWQSSDGTVEYVSQMSQDDARVHLLEVEQRGLGTALRQAHDHALRFLEADYVAQMDADLSHAPTYLPDLLGSLSQGYDFAIGSRYVDGGGTRNWPISRQVQSNVANYYIRLMTGFSEPREWTSGYRAFTAALYQRMDLSRIGYRDYTFQPAFVHAALLAGARLKEVPIIFVNRTWGKSKLPLFGYTFNLLGHFARARLRRRAELAKVWPQRLPD